MTRTGCHFSDFAKSSWVKQKTFVSIFEFKAEVKKVGCNNQVVARNKPVLNLRVRRLWPTGDLNDFNNLGCSKLKDQLLHHLKLINPEKRQLAEEPTSSWKTQGNSQHLFGICYSPLKKKSGHELHDAGHTPRQNFYSVKFEHRRAFLCGSGPQGSIRSHETLPSNPSICLFVQLLYDLWLCANFLPERVEAAPLETQSLRLRQLLQNLLQNPRVTWGSLGYFQNLPEPVVATSETYDETWKSVYPRSLWGIKELQENPPWQHHEP